MCVSLGRSLGQCYWSIYHGFLWMVALQVTFYLFKYFFGWKFCNKHVSITKDIWPGTERWWGRVGSTSGPMAAGGTCKFVCSPTVASVHKLWVERNSVYWMCQQCVCLLPHVLYLVHDVTGQMWLDILYMLIVWLCIQFMISYTHTPYTYSWWGKSSLFYSNQKFNYSILNRVTCFHPPISHSCFVLVFFFWSIK